MKHADEIEARIRLLLAEALERKVAEASKRLPCRCTYNYQHNLDTRRQVEGDPNPNFNRITANEGEPVAQTIGLCMYGAQNPEDWKGDICEDPIDAQRCPYFQPALYKEAIWRDFQTMLQDHDRLRAELPEVYGLLWALDGYTSSLKLPWWKRLWFWFLRVRVEPLSTNNVDPLKLLPESKE